jgi:hypothetical protein
MRFVVSYIFCNLWFAFAAQETGEVLTPVDFLPHLDWNLAIQGRQRRSPFSLITGSASAEIDPQSTKLGSAGGLGRTAKNIGSPGDLELHKTGHDYGHL